MYQKQPKKENNTKAKQITVRNKQQNIIKNKNTNQNKTDEKKEDLLIKQYANLKQKKSIFVVYLLDIILTEKEISELEKEYPSIKRTSYENQPANKYDLIMDTLKEAQKIINEKNTNKSFNKLFDWVITNVQSSLNVTQESIKDYQKFNPQNQDSKFVWMKKYSPLDYEMDYLEIVDRNNNGNKKDDYKTNTSINKNQNNKTHLVKNVSTKNLLSKINPFDNDELLNFTSEKFDIFQINNILGPENTMLMISTFIFTSNNYFSIINPFKFENFVTAIAYGYNDNPYHSALHAADITQTIFVFVHYSNFQIELQLQDIDMIALYISCIIHDYKHPGFTNNFLINDNNPIAITYNDKSVLESYHVAESYKLINSDKKYDIFEGISTDKYKLMRKKIIENVLGTDMSFHQDHLLFLKKQIQNLENNKLSQYIDKLETLDKYDTQIKYLKMLVHASDISNPTKPNSVYVKWAQKVIDEFFLQGDLEFSQNKKISPLCDRKTVTLAKSQIGFIEGVVKPYFTCVCKVLNGIDFLNSNVDYNLQYFKNKTNENDNENN